MNIITVRTSNQAKLDIEAGVDVIIFEGSTWCRVFVQKSRTDIIALINHHLGLPRIASDVHSIKFFAQRTTAGQAKQLLLQFVEAKPQPSTAVDEVGIIGS